MVVPRRNVTFEAGRFRGMAEQRRQFPSLSAPWKEALGFPRCYGPNGFGEPLPYVAGISKLGLLYWLSG